MKKTLFIFLIFGGVTDLIVASPLDSLMKSAKAYYIGNTKKNQNKSITRYIIKNNQNLYTKLIITCEGQCEEDNECYQGFKIFSCKPSKNCKKSEKLLNTDSPDLYKDRNWLFE